jgi:hypothetical protein
MADAGGDLQDVVCTHGTILVMSPASPALHAEVFASTVIVTSLLHV